MRFDKHGNCFTKKERKEYFTPTFLLMTKQLSDKQRLEILNQLGLL